MISDISREKGKYLSATKEGVTSEGASRSRLLKAGSLLLSNSGSVCIPKILKIDGCIHDGFVTFPDLPDHVSSEFLYYWFEFIRPQVIQANKQGITQVNLNTGIVRELDVPLPPPEEQHRIVAKIDELFSDLDAGVAALERAKVNLKRYRAAVLKAAVEGKLTEEWRAERPDVEPASKLLERILAERRRKWETDQLTKFAAAGKQPPKNWQAKYVEPTPPDVEGLPELPKGWCWTTIHQLNNADRPISYGVLQPGSDLGEGIPLVRVCDVAEGRVAVEHLKKISPSISNQFRRTILQGGEVLLTVVGTIGRTAIVPVELAGANTARAVAVIAVVPPGNASFLEMTLRESSMRAKLSNAAHEVARKTLNLEDVRVVAVPLPPTEEQRIILDEVAEKLSQIDAAEATVEHSLVRSTHLRQAILKKAFRGKLLPHG